LGVVIWQLLLGTTPFKAPSPYLGFLKIKRGILYRHPALEDDAWDLISKLIKVQPEKRIGAGRKFDEIKNHPYFSAYPSLPDLPKKPAETVPTLRDLAIRAVAEQAIVSSLDPDATDPGTGGPDDMMRMNKIDRERVMHFLDRLQKLQEPRVLRRFYSSTMEAKMSRVRPLTRDFLGLTSEREVRMTQAIRTVALMSTNTTPSMACFARHRASTTGR
jgi:serine/threonine protein kinase